MRSTHYHLCSLQGEIVSLCVWGADGWKGNDITLFVQTWCLERLQRPG